MVPLLRSVEVLTKGGKDGVARFYVAKAARCAAAAHSLIRIGISAHIAPIKGSSLRSSARSMKQPGTSAAQHYKIHP